MKIVFYVALAGAISASVSFAFAKDFSVHSNGVQGGWRGPGAAHAPPGARAPMRPAPTLGRSEIGRIHSQVVPQGGWRKPHVIMHRPVGPHWREGSWRHVAPQRPHALQPQRYRHVPLHAHVPHDGRGLLYAQAPHWRWRAAPTVHASAAGYGAYGARAGIYEIAGSYDPPPPPRPRPIRAYASHAAYSAAPQVIHGYPQGGWRGPVPVVYGAQPAPQDCVCQPAPQPLAYCPD